MINKTTLCTAANCGGTTLVTMNLAHPKTINARTIEMEIIYDSPSQNGDNGVGEHNDEFPTDPNGEDWRGN